MTSAAQTGGVDSTAQRDPRVAIVSLHSHGDRSFLDDRDLAVLAGDMEQLGYPCDHVIAVIDEEGSAPSADETVSRLADMLSDYEVVAYERIFSRALADRLRELRRDATWVHLRGEHELYDPPADFVLDDMSATGLAALTDYVAGDRSAPPRVRVRRGDGVWERVGTEMLAKPPRLAFRPNLKPRVVNPEKLPDFRSFALVGNAGCPYQADARDNPLYDGVEIPDGLGRGCAFCTTGNSYEGRSRDATLETVLEQVRFMRSEAPQLNHLVLKDQNPFAYLTELIEACVSERLAPFTIMLETRADWFLRSGARLERALQACATAGYSIAPFLIGIENFSQPQLDRYNKGIDAKTNIEFLQRLWSLHDRFGDALNLKLGAFGFVLFNPWTTLQDLRVNYDAIVETRFHRLRGHVLLSRARLYPDTALFYLARHDGLLIEEFTSARNDPSRRYGYFPSQPWRFADPDVSHFAELATELSERTAGRDHMTLYRALLEEFETAADAASVQGEQVMERYGRLVSGDRDPASRDRNAGADPALRQRFEALLAPLDLSDGFAGGWTLRTLSRSEAGLGVVLACAGEELLLRFAVRRPGTQRAGFFRSRHYELFYDHSSLSSPQRAALDAICGRLRANDR